MTTANIAWFTRDDDLRIIEASDDEMVATFDQWEAKMLKMLDGLEAQGVVPVKVPVSAAELITFANSSGRKIDTHARAELAAAKLMKTHKGQH
jgi:hypothetical protein